MIQIEDKGIHIKITHKGDYSTSNFMAFNETQLFQILNKLGVPWEEIEFMAEEMDEKGHNYAEFGRYKSFIYSKFQGGDN